LVPLRVARGDGVAVPETGGEALLPLRVARGDGVAVPETGGEALVPWRVARGDALVPLTREGVTVPWP
jgi:hypothetical protein